MTKLTRDAWIESGLRMLDATGHGALSIERLARRLAVTRGSFYHHFSSKKSFVDGLLDRWETDYTVAVIAEARRERGAERRLARYVQVVSTMRAEREVAIRAWAATSEQVHAVVERVDRARFTFAHEIAREILPKASADRVAAFARLSYLGLIGMQQIEPQHRGRFTDFIDDLRTLAKISSR